MKKLLCLLIALLLFTPANVYSVGNSAGPLYNWCAGNKIDDMCPNVVTPGYGTNAKDDCRDEADCSAPGVPYANCDGVDSSSPSIGAMSPQATGFLDRYIDEWKCDWIFSIPDARIDLGATMDYLYSPYRYLNDRDPDIIAMAYVNWNDTIGGTLLDNSDFVGNEDWLYHFIPYHAADNWHYRTFQTFGAITDPISESISGVTPYNTYHMNIYNLALRDFWASAAIAHLEEDRYLSGYHFDTGGWGGTDRWNIIASVYDDPVNYTGRSNFNRGERCPEAAGCPDGASGVAYGDLITLKAYAYAKQAMADLIATKIAASSDIEQSVHSASNIGQDIVNDAYCIDDDIPWNCCSGAGTGNCPDEKAFIASIGGGLTEGQGWWAHKGSTTLYNGMGGPDGQYTEDYWKAHTDMIKDQMDAGYPMLIILYAMVEDFSGSQGVPDGVVDDKDWVGYTNTSGRRSKMLFLYASALMAGGAEGDPLYLRYRFNSYITWEGWHLDLGFAQGAYTQDWGAHDGLYYRRFDNAIVLVNPTDTDITAVNPGVSYKRVSDNSIMTANKDWSVPSTFTTGNITVEAYSGEILLTQPFWISGPYPTSQQTFINDPQDVVMGVTTNENGTCKYESTATANVNTAYADLDNTFTTTGGTTHTETVSQAAGASTSYIVKCSETATSTVTPATTIVVDVAATPGVPAPTSVVTSVKGGGVITVKPNGTVSIK